ncbi:DUF7710 domain-containing protein [Comamonas sediminis]|uniref:DUF7710 domain-containing protein n=1 Tax=Comamonas sediminis TaxID=1783360 RepID=A0ABV4B1H7_9BURK
MNEMEMEATVWIFVATKAAFPSGVFGSVADAENWIVKHGLTGLLTEYPIGTGVFDWAIASGKFKPKPAKKLDAAFIGQFTTASMAHHHYEDGCRQD